MFPHQRCLRPDERSAEIWFDAPDGTRLSGVTLGSGTTGVLLAHQHWFNLCSWMPFARDLSRTGYRVLAFDFRGSGASPAPDQRVARNLDQDVAGGVRELRRLGAQRVVLVGASMGATASLVEAAHPIHPPELPVAGVVSVSGPTHFYEMNALAAVERLHAPLLLIATAQDGRFTAAARSFYRAAPSVDKRLVILSGKGHGTGLLTSSTHSARLRSLVLGFIREHAGPMPQTAAASQRTIRPSR
ncbi:MAG TPA: alpha/beta fold hydrolase [Actinomycetota bacterium]|nr:alpha/beta fold hydrolase [Actinomycetota bacterium]